MRAVIQRVSRAGVTIEGRIHSQIGIGLLVLIAVTETDTGADVAWMSGKISRLRIFNDSTGVMNRSVEDVNGGMLVVSQFTLYGSTRKGNRPSFIRSARPEHAVPLYESFLRHLAADLGRPVASGVFGAEMHVELVNDGPVTLIIDTQHKE